MWLRAGEEITQEVASISFSLSWAIFPTPIFSKRIQHFVSRPPRMVHAIAVAAVVF
jgi:hypothetical protein